MRILGVFALLGLLSTGGAVHTARADTLTVVTLNLWHDQRDWPKRVAVILAEMRSLRPDVICLQEVLQHETLRNQAQTLADSLGLYMHFTSVDSETSSKRYGNAILTRHRVRTTGGKALAPLDDYRTVAHMRIDFAGRPLDVYDTHLHHTPEGAAIRSTQIRDLLAFIDSTRGPGAMVLAGDFNTRPDTPELELLAPAFQNVFLAVHPRATPAEAATFNPRFSVAPGHIDHIFVPRRSRPSLVPLASQILFRDPGPDSVWASDHFGVMARLRVGRR